MAVLPRALVWKRTDTIGGEFVGFGDRDGLSASGLAFAGTPVTYAVRYQIRTDPAWSSTQFEASAEGEGWQRTIDMRRTNGTWRVTASEHGNLNAVEPNAPLAGIEDPSRLMEAFDVDLYHSPLTRTLPIRRLNLLSQPPGSTRTVVVAWILLPSLAVLPLEQTYTRVDERTVRCASKVSTVDLTVDDDGFVLADPPVATR